MTPEQVEKLLMPRYEVIADYPLSQYGIGDIIIPDKNGKAVVIYGTDNKEDDKEKLDAYPHLFRKLSWWEHREESEMPGYVKVYDWVKHMEHYGVTANSIHKAIRYDVRGEPWEDVYLILSNKEKSLTLKYVEPATLDQYNTYINQK